MTQELVTRRNTETFKKMFEDMHSRINEQEQRIIAQQNSIATLSQRVISLETQLLTFKVRVAGTGPSTTS